MVKQTFNIDESVIENLGWTSAGSLVKTKKVNWIISFSMHIGSTTNNSAELCTFYQVLSMVLNMGYRIIILEYDFLWLFNQ